MDTNHTIVCTLVKCPEIDRYVCMHTARAYCIYLNILLLLLLLLFFRLLACSLTHALACAAYCQR